MSRRTRRNSISRFLRVNYVYRAATSLSLSLNRWNFFFRREKPGALALRDDDDGAREKVIVGGRLIKNNRNSTVEREAKGKNSPTQG